MRNFNIILYYIIGVDMDFLYKVRDPIHGFIRFTEQERQIIDRTEFQRLRNVKQLATTYLVYPGAMHTRFEHSLGVMELATRAFDALCRKNSELIKQNFKSISLTISEALAVLRMAALLHDIGHLPFSHGAENILPQGKKHEDVSIEIIDYLKDIIDNVIFSGATKLIKYLIKKEYLIQEVKFLSKILSGQIDADRMDYLLRDSHHCGVDYGHFDYLRLLETFLLIDSLEGGLDLAIDRGGVQVLESLILARYYMFAQVYCHRTRRIYDIYLQNYMSDWGKNKVIKLIDVLKYDDINIINAMRNDLNSNEPRKRWAEKLLCRVNHSMIYETSNFADGDDRRKAVKIHKQLQQDFPEVSFIIDLEDAKGYIHKFFKRGEDQITDEFFVISKTGQRLITEESTIIHDLPKRFHVVRIYVDAPTDEVLNKIRERIKSLG